MRPGDLRVYAFASPDLSQVTVVGINAGATMAARLNIPLDNFPLDCSSRKVNLYLTSEQENCALLQRIPVRSGNWPFDGIDACIPPASIFTLTNVQFNG